MFRCLCVILSLFAFHLPAVELKDLTFARLAANPCTDHVVHFDKLFRSYNVESLLEFGLGHGTKYLLEHCNRVTSVEILLSSQTTEWAEQMINLYSRYPHWAPIVQRADPSFDVANTYAMGWQDPSRFDSLYRLELKRICDQLFSQNAYDVVFVDPGFHFRSDLVKELFDRAPIIVAHDTSDANEIYGWNRIYTPSNYEKIHFSQGQGTTMWVSKKLANVISALKQTPTLEAERKKLRVFFPMIHYALTESLAKALAYLGHTLVLPGNSFIYAFGFPKSVCELSNYYANTSAIAPYLEVLEVDQMIKSPPDIFIANCEFTEAPVYAVVDYLRAERIANPALVHLSGNNGTPFSEERVEHLIAIDAYTPFLFDLAKVELLRWVPWVDFDQLPFKGVSDQLVLNNFLTHYYQQVYFLSAQVFQENKELIERTFPQVSIQSPPYLAREQVLDRIDASCATMHIKELEGFGYGIVESIAKGRPVILKRSFSSGLRLMNWCIEGKTAIFFEDYAELEPKLRRYVQNAEYRHAFQKGCAETVRSLWNNEQQARMLDAFLQKAASAKEPLLKSQKENLIDLFKRKIGKSSRL